MRHLGSAEINNIKLHESNVINSILNGEMIMVIKDAAVTGYQIGASGDTFLSSHDGLVVWGEEDGSCHVFEGFTKVRILNTVDGPMLEISNDSDGMMRPRTVIKCIDLLGIAPVTSLDGRLDIYKETILDAKSVRTIH